MFAKTDRFRSTCRHLFFLLSEKEAKAEGFQPAHGWENDFYGSRQAASNAGSVSRRPMDRNFRKAYDDVVDAVERLAGTELFRKSG